MQGDLSILYVLMGVIILLALLAAIGAWTRNSGLKRDDAESLFSETQEKHREEVARLEKIIETQRIENQESLAKADAALSGKLHELDTHINRTRSDVESAVARASTDQCEALSDELELVSRKIGESERRMTTAVDSLQVQVSKAGEQMKEALLEITRQQQDQKAQSTIQMCEALITSLGTLKSSISNQITQGSSSQTIDADRSENVDNSDDEIQMPGEASADSDIDSDADTEHDIIDSNTDSSEADNIGNESWSANGDTQEPLTIEPNVLENKEDTEVKLDELNSDAAIAEDSDHDDRFTR